MVFVARAVTVQLVFDQLVQAVDGVVEADPVSVRALKMFVLNL